jgi:hypothetical protein
VVITSGIWTLITFVSSTRTRPTRIAARSSVSSGKGLPRAATPPLAGNVTIGPSKEQIEQISKAFGGTAGPEGCPDRGLDQIATGEKSGGGARRQQAVGAAVGSIAQGAAEGDTRLQQTLGLLKENKIAKATRHLNAVAEDKAARAT